MTSITTKTGDDGTTFDGAYRAYKDSPKINLLGAVDELSCMLGVAYGYADVKTRNLINETQAHLYMFGGFISVGTPCPIQTWIEVMELDIIEWEAELPELKDFIKPRAYLQLCRAVCRRAEREAVAYHKYIDIVVSQSTTPVEIKEEMYENHKLIVRFLNRLSDWLFMLARKTEHMV